MKQFSLLALVLGLIPTIGMARKEVNPEVLRLQRKAAQMEAELGSYEDKLKGIEFDHGKQNELNEERELLRSRLARVKERLRMLTGIEEPTPAPEGATAGAHSSGH